MRSLVVALLCLTVFAACKQKNRSLEPIKKESQNANPTDNRDNLPVNADEIEVSAVIENAPAGESRLTRLNLQVSGENLTEIVYKIGPTISTECGLADGWSLAPIGEIEIDLTGLPDGELILCVVGKHESGIWQDFAKASSAIWVKSTGQLPSPSVLNAVPAQEKVSLFWEPTAGAEGYIIVKSNMPIDWAPTAGEDYELGTEIANMQVVHNSELASFIDTDVVDGSSYHYGVFSYDIEKNYSAAVKKSAIPGAEAYAWIKLGPGAHTQGAVPAGTRSDGSRELYVCRGEHFDAAGNSLGLHPGKFFAEVKGDLSQGRCYFPYGPDNIRATEFEILVMTRGSFADTFAWQATSQPGLLPPTSFIAGEEPGNNLYSCRYPNGPMQYIVVGKTLPGSDGCAADTFANGVPSQTTQPVFEILVRK